jgi:WD40 repeat protein
MDMPRWLLIGFALTLVAAAPPRQGVLRTRLVLKGAAKGVSALAFDPSGRLLVVAGHEPGGQGEQTWAGFRVWDLASGKLRASWRKQQEWPVAVAFLPDGKTIVSLGRTRERTHWDSTTGEAKRSFPAPRRGGGGNGKLAVSRDGKQVAIVDETFCLGWETASGKELFRHKRVVYGFGAVLAHDLRLLAAPNHQDVDLWDVRTGKLVRSLFEHRGSVSRLCFSRDDRLLAVACYRRTDDDKDVHSIWLWDVRRGVRLRIVPLGNLFCQSLALSPDRALLGMAGSLEPSGPAELRLLDTASGSERARLQLPGVRWIDNLTFSPDGKLLAVSCDRDVRLWSVAWPAGKGKR